MELDWVKSHRGYFVTGIQLSSSPSHKLQPQAPTQSQSTVAQVHPLDTNCTWTALRIPSLAEPWRDL